MSASPLAPNATARLTMVSGSPCSIAEFAMYLDQYDYVPDASNERRWVLNDPESRNASEPMAIVLDDPAAPVEAMDVYGQGSEHFTNLNYLMQRCGWQSCAVVCRNDDINAKMLARFVSVEVESDISLPASSLDANQEHAPAEPAQPAPGAPTTSRSTFVPALVQGGATEPEHMPAPDAPSIASAPGDDAEGEMERLQQRVRALTIELNAAQELSATVEAENLTLRERIQLLESQSHQLVRQSGSQPTSVPTEAGAASAASLLHVVEKYVLPTVDLGKPSSSELLADLRNAGYEIRLRLVPAA